MDFYIIIFHKHLVEYMQTCEHGKFSSYNGLAIILFTFTSTLALPLFNTSRSEQNCHFFADNNFKCMMLSQNRILITMISMALPHGPIDDELSMVPGMALHRIRDTTFPGMIMTLFHISVIRP